MKKIIFAIAALMGVALTSCNRVSQEQYQQATSTNDSLMYVALQQGNEIYELSTTLKAVSEQLDQINGQLEISNGEDQGLVAQRDRLLQKLATVQNTIIEKQQALDELQKKYSAQLGQNKVLKQTIERLQTEISGYQQEIAGYKVSVAQKEQQIAGLTDTLAQTQQTLKETVEESEQRQEVINVQDQMLNTGYYVIGDKALLRTMGLLEGGVFTKKRLTTQGFSHEYFQQIDIRELSQLPLGAKKVDILTSHPSDSYQLQAQADGSLLLVITDNSAFWKNSRFLVVKTK